MPAQFKDEVTPFDASRRDWERVEMGGAVRNGDFIAADIESYFYGGRDPWWADGIALPADLPWQEAQEAAGMQWETRKLPVITAEGSKPVPGVFAIERNDNGVILPGAVGNDFRPFSNTELFQFGAAVLEQERAMVNAAYVRKGGIEVSILFRLHDDIVIGGDPDERIDPFLLVTAGHVGNRPLSAVTTPVRVECRNTQALALKEAQRMFRAKHTSNIVNRAKEAQQALSITVGYYKALQELGDLLITKKVDGSKFLARLVPYVTEADGYKDAERANLKRGELRSLIRRIHDEAPDQQNIKGSGWGWLQAAIRYHEYLTPIRAGGNVEKIRYAHYERAVITTGFNDRALAIVQEA
jgi:phage/plasmid-like protein (TIGR03299 family)